VVLTAGPPTTGNGSPGQNDTVNGIEDVFGTEGADKITGSDIGNVLYGFSGNDLITGGKGPDNINGGGDDDQLDSVDNESDRVDCGGQVGDRARVENIDQVRNCPAASVTTVQAAGPPAPVVIRDPGDKTKARMAKLKAARKAKAKKLRGNGRYTFSFVPNEAVTGDFSLDMKVKRLPSNATKAAAGFVTLAEKRRKLAANKKATITLQIGKSLRAGLKKGKTMRLLISLRDGNNNITTRTVAIKLT
jgi:hypothetical protein